MDIVRDTDSSDPPVGTSGPRLGGDRLAADATWDSTLCAPQARRTCLAPGAQASMAFAGAEGLRIIGVIAGSARARRRPPFGVRAVTLDAGEIICSLAEDVCGFFDNTTDDPATVVDAVVPFARFEPDTASLLRKRFSAERKRPGGDVIHHESAMTGLVVCRCPVTTVVLDALTANTTTRSQAYRDHAGSYLAAHLSDLLATSGSIVLDRCHRRRNALGPQATDPTVPSPRPLDEAGNSGDPRRRDARAFTLEQQVALLEAMQARLGERVRNEELAALVGYSQFHFLRRFQATFGQTPYQYLTAQRISAAQLWLAEPHPRSLGWIAAQCGFTRTESFIRAFRDRTGITPARYAAAASSRRGDSPRQPSSPGLSDLGCNWSDTPSAARWEEQS